MAFGHVGELATVGAGVEARVAGVALGGGFEGSYCDDYVGKLLSQSQRHQRLGTRSQKVVEQVGGRPQWADAALLLAVQS